MGLHRRSLGLLAVMALTATGFTVVSSLAGPAGAVVAPTAHTIAAGGVHSLVVKTDGTLWTFGYNGNGQLGHDIPSGTEDLNPTPIRVMAGVAEVAAGHWHSLVVKTDGTLWSFGSNNSGQLGTATNAGTENANTVPTQVMTGVAHVAAGWEHSLVVKTDGTLWSFGSNNSGQLGTATNAGTGNPNPIPTQVMTGVAEVAAGDGHSLVVKTDGTLWAFGQNGAGQLGTTTNSGTGKANPIPVQILSGVAHVAAGVAHSLVVKTDGTLWAFGQNGAGQLGTTEIIDASKANPTPTQIMTGVAHVAAGWEYSLIVKTDGTLWSFGSNNSGQLGTATNAGTGNPNPIPTQVMTDVAQIASCHSHSLIVKTDGTVWTFGDNDSGELGNGTATNIGTGQTVNPTPTQIMTAIAATTSTTTAKKRVTTTTKLRYRQVCETTVRNGRKVTNCRQVRIR